MNPFKKYWEGLSERQQAGIRYAANIFILVFTVWVSVSVISYICNWKADQSALTAGGDVRNAAAQLRKGRTLIVARSPGCIGNHDDTRPGSAGARDERIPDLIRYSAPADDQQPTPVRPVKGPGRNNRRRKGTRLCLRCDRSSRLRRRNDRQQTSERHEEDSVPLHLHRMAGIRRI